MRGKWAAFGAFGWSGEACDRIFDTMKHILKMDMAASALRLKSSLLGGGVQMAQDYGREIAKNWVSNRMKINITPANDFI